MERRIRFKRGKIMEIEYLLDYLRDEILLLGNNGANIMKCIKILDNIKVKYSESYESLINAAKNEAQKLIQDAKSRADYIVSMQNQKLNNKRFADDIIKSAYAKSDMLIERAKKHLDKTFMQVENFFLGAIRMIKINRQELAKSLTV